MIVHNPHDAEELLQDTASILWEQFDRYQEGTSFGAWAITVAKIKAFEYLRENKKKRLLLKNETYKRISELAEPTSTDTADHIEAIRDCLEKLDNSCRSLLSMRYKKNLQIKEISKITHKSPGVLYKTLSRVLDNLRDCIKRTMKQQELA